MRRLAASLLVVLALSACGPAPMRLAVPPADAGAPIGIGFASVEVLGVSLPAYAEGDEVFVRGPGLALMPAAGAMWADEPARALTLDLTRALGDVTGARVAPDPWPFDEPPDARLDVRLADFVADAAGAFVLSGQYYVGAFDGTGRDRSREFRISVPVAPEGGVAAIAAARGQATVALAREIAADGLR